MNKDIVKWAVIENICILIFTGIMVYITRSGWCFLILLLCNSFKIKDTGTKKPNQGENDERSVATGSQSENRTPTP